MQNNFTLNLIRNEFNDLSQKPLVAIGANVGLLDQNNPYIWKCTMMGPKNTSYSGGLFYLKIQFPLDYPQRAPEVTFVTPIYHVNVNHKPQPGCPLGHICISTLYFWNPQYRIRDILTSIFALFYMGNPESPYGLDRQNEMMNNHNLYEKKIKYFTKKYADIRIGYKEYDFWDFTYFEDNN